MEPGYSFTKTRLPPFDKEAFNANRILWNLMGNCSSVEGHEEIVITGQVLADGRGDWAAIRKIQKTLQKKFPDRIVRIIASSAEKWRQPGLLDTSNIRALDLAYYQNNSNFGALVPLSAFPNDSKIIENVQKAGVVISAGVDITSVFDSVFDEIHRKCIKIKEHDFSTACGGKLFGSTRLQMGIAPKDDRVGIFIAKDKNYTWDHISNTHLKSALFGLENPSKEKLDHYSSTHSCFFGYLSAGFSYIHFIRDAIVFANANLENKSIDVCLPGHNLLLYFKKEYFEEFGIGSVIFIWFNGIENQKHEMHFGKGKSLRIIDPGSLSPKDFKIMMSISAPLVGCRGDSSLALALSFGKIPCYENRFIEKADALLSRIEDLFSQESALYKYCKGAMLPPLLRTTENASLLKLAKQAKLLGQFMREKANFQPILKGIVNERLLRQTDPDFAEKSDQLRESYLQKKISQTELTDQFTALLSEKGLSTYLQDTLLDPEITNLSQ